MDNKKEYILCAAWKRKTPRCIEKESTPYKVENNDILNIEIGYRHHDIYFRFGDELDTVSEDCMGFYTSYGRFVNRLEGMKIAYTSGQISENRAFWTKESIDFCNKIGLSCKNINPGDFAELASEDLYCCSPDGDSMNE